MPEHKPTSHLGMAKITLIVSKDGRATVSLRYSTQPDLTVLQAGAGTVSTSPLSLVDLSDRASFYNPQLHVPYLGSNGNTDSDFAWSDLPPSYWAI